MKRNVFIYILTTLAVFFLDQITKFWAVSTLEPFKPIPIIGNWFRFTLVYNKNAAFSVSYGTPMIRTIVMGIATVFVVAYVIASIRKGEKFKMIFSLSMILGGAFGNLVDRIRMSQVVDFIEMGIAPKHLYWPVYNVADSFVVVGVFILVLTQFKRGKNEAISE